jgi:AsmA protein
MLGGSAGDGSAGGNDQPGGTLVQTLGTMIQQGLRQSRTISPATPAPAAPAQSDQTPQPSQDSQPMNDILRQLFNR